MDQEWEWKELEFLENIRGFQVIFGDRPIEEVSKHNHFLNFLDYFARLPSNLKSSEFKGSLSLVKCQFPYE